MNIQTFSPSQFADWLSFYERQDYFTFDSQPTESVLAEHGFDLVSPKFDGQLGIGYVEEASSEGKLSILLYSRTRQLKRRVVINHVPGTVPTGAVLFGESIVGTNWAVNSKWRDSYFVFDILTQDTQFGERAKYIQRVVRPCVLWEPLLRLQHTLGYMDVVRGDFEGVCFAKSNDTIPLPFFGRYKKGLELSGRVVGFDPGLGKYSGQVGAIKVRLDSGVVTSCSGMDDSLRFDMTQNPTAYLGREIEITATRLFPSGLPRHPQFKRLK